MRDEQAKNYDTTAKEISDIYSAWLSYSGISDSFVLEKSILSPITFNAKTLDSGVLSVSLCVGNEQVGASIDSPSGSCNSEFAINASLLLLFITNRLDNERSNKYAFGKTGLENKGYYTAECRRFIKNTLDKYIED